MAAADDGDCKENCAILPDPAAREQPVAMDERRLSHSMSRRGRWLATEPAILASAAQMLVERTQEIFFTPSEVLDLGCRTGTTARLLRLQWPNTPVVSLIMPGAAPLAKNSTPLCARSNLLKLPFAKETFSLVLSNMALQWSGHLARSLREVKRVMKADGVFLCTLPGDENLYQLRESMAEVDREFFGQPVVRVMNGYSIHQVGDALQGVGFSFPVADREQAHLKFANIGVLFATLRRMGAVNPFPTGPALTRSYLRRLEEVYRGRFQQDNQLILTVDVLFGHGWKQPLARG